ATPPGPPPATVPGVAQPGAAWPPSGVAPLHGAMPPSGVMPPPGATPPPPPGRRGHHQ
ncbi:response regulator, partial [Micromonospora sp. KC606]